MKAKLLNASSLGKDLGVSCKTVIDWTTNGVIPAEIHEGRVYRFDLANVRAALAERASQKAKGGSQ